MRLCTRSGMDSLKEDETMIYTKWLSKIMFPLNMIQFRIVICNLTNLYFIMWQSVSQIVLLGIPSWEVRRWASPIGIWSKHCLFSIHLPYEITRGVNPSFAWTDLDMPNLGAQMHEKMDQTRFLLGEVPVSYAAATGPDRVPRPAVGTLDTSIFRNRKAMARSSPVVSLMLSGCI